MRTLILLCFLTTLASTTAAARQPNVVVILTDDQGWGDLSVNGNTNLSTPNVDSLARDGATLEHFYVCAVCAPTRAEFLTGRYYPRTGVSGVSRGEGRLNADESTIGDVFKRAGYVTGAFGKWHNGTQPPLHPNDRGFDEFYGFTSGHWGHYFSPPLDHNRRRVRGNGFIINDLTDHAVRFIRKNQDRPFFCYVPYNTPHSPMMVPDEDYSKFAGMELEMRNRSPEKEDIMMTRAALALCENIDDNVGRILGALDEFGLSKETIVVYFCDNGPNSVRWNGGMKGRKGSIDEGGVRSPFFIRWPGTIPAGKRVAQIGAAIDLLPTLSSLAGIDGSVSKPIDGRDLTPLLLKDNSDWPERTLVSFRRGSVSLRTQKFRLDGAGRLFDIEADPGQYKNLADQHPDVMASLRTQSKSFEKEMQNLIAQYSGRPFHVGFGPLTTLPARDGVEHGNIQRSAKAPNNSFFTNWTSVDDSITWNIKVGTAGSYDVTLHYTCAAGDEGATVTLGVDGGTPITKMVTDVFDPPLYAKPKERVTGSHYFVKDFKAVPMGSLRLDAGKATLRLGSRDIRGQRVIDVHSIDLVLRGE